MASLGGLLFYRFSGKTLVAHTHGLYSSCSLQFWLMARSRL